MRVAGATFVPRVLLLLGIFLTPVVFDLGTIKPFDVVKITALCVFTLAAAGAWGVEAALGRVRPRWPRMTRYWAAFLVAIGLATVFSQTPVVSVVGTYGRYNGLFQLTVFVLLSAIVAQLYRGRPDRSGEIFFALGAASVVVVGYIIVQYLGLDPIGWSRPTGEELGFPYFGTLGNSNFAGGYLGATSPWLLYAWMRSGRPWQRIAVAAWALVHLWALWLTSSRGGLIAVMVGAAATVIVFRHRLPRWVLPAGGVAAAAAATVVAVMVVWQPSALPGPLDDLRVLRSESLEVRAYWWDAAVGIYADNPVVGAGPDTFAVTYPRYVSPDAAGLPDAEVADKPHNVILEYASSAGTLGLLAFLLVVGSAAWWGLRRMRSATDRREQAVIASSVALLGAYLGQAFFSIDVAPMAMVGWVSIGALVAMADPAFLREETDVPPPALSVKRLVAVALVVLLTGVAIAVALRPWRADRAAKEGDSARVSNASAGAVLGPYERAIDLHPYEPVYRSLVGTYLIRRSAMSTNPNRQQPFLRDALRNFERADELQPDHHVWKMYVGDALGRLGALEDERRFREAERWLEEAEELAPLDFRVPSQLGVMYNRWALATGDRHHHCQALDALRRSIELDRHVPLVWVEFGRTMAFMGLLDRAQEAVEHGLGLDPDVAGGGELLRGIEERVDTDLPRLRCPTA